VTGCRGTLYQWKTEGEEGGASAYTIKFRSVFSKIKEGEGKSEERKTGRFSLPGAAGRGNKIRVETLENEGKSTRKKIKRERKEPAPGKTLTIPNRKSDGNGGSAEKVKGRLKKKKRLHT